MSFWDHVKAIILLPLMVLVTIPIIILIVTDSTYSLWNTTGTPQKIMITLAVLLIMGGLAIMIKSITLFNKIGAGTLAPWDETQKLVVVGLYGYVRNPMLIGVCSILLGETILSGSIALLFYSLIFVTGNIVYTHYYEEPRLVERFGEQYIEYRENVPAWIPKRKKWLPDDKSDNK